MNPFLQSILFALVRSGLLWLSGHLGVQSTEAEILSAATAIVGVLWAIWAQYKAHQFTVTAQSLDGASTREEVKAVIAAGGAPSVLTPASVVPQA